MVDEEGGFILWLMLKGINTVSGLARESSLPKTTVYRKLRELEERGWISGERGRYEISERGKALLRMRACEVLGSFYVESLYLRAMKLTIGGWEKALEALKMCTDRFVLTYETAAYLLTGFQVPSAVFAYVPEEELMRVANCTGGRRSGYTSDLVLIPVRELPLWETVKGLRVVRRERLKLELLTWLGRGVLDLVALGEKLPDVAEEITDVLTR